LGAVVVAFEAYVMVKWVTGPNFKRVPSGPSVPPTWMKAVLISAEILAPIAALAFLFRVVVRPWLRERVVTTDGLMCVAFLFMVIQDPLANYFAPYMTYNAYLVNFGSWVSDVPGWQSYGRPGAMLVEPIIFQPANYILAPLLTMMVGCKALDWLKRRRPTIGNVRLVGTLFAGMLVLWPIIEGGIYMPLGVFTFSGGSLSIFPDAYHKYPLQQLLCAAAFMTVFTAFRYFRDERGHSVVERGVERLQVGAKHKVALRFLAVLGVFNVMYLATYNLPLALWTHATVGNWPADVQRRSYLTDRLCGDGTQRACPGASSPREVPFASTDSKPFAGPVLGNTK
jgi:multisubunit Na+/H+ antiporter MnhF subunit